MIIDLKTPLTAAELEQISELAIGVSSPAATNFELLPAPAGGRPAIVHKGQEPVAVWEYYDTRGRLDGYVCRFDTIASDGAVTKKIRPYRYGALNGEVCGFR